MGTEEEEKKCKEPVEIPIEGADGKTTKMKRIVDNLTGARKEIKGQKEPSYEVKFNQLPHDANLYLKQSFLAKAGFEKHMKAVDEKIAIREGFFAKPLTSANVEQHIGAVGRAEGQGCPGRRHVEPAPHPHPRRAHQLLGPGLSRRPLRRHRGVRGRGGHDHT